MARYCWGVSLQGRCQPGFCFLQGHEKTNIFYEANATAWQTIDSFNRYFQNLIQYWKNQGKTEVIFLLDQASSLEVSRNRSAFFCQDM